jgi:hypothetical protein
MICFSQTFKESRKGKFQRLCQGKLWAGTLMLWRYNRKGILQSKNPEFRWHVRCSLMRLVTAKKGAIREVGLGASRKWRAGKIDGAIFPNVIFYH